MSALQLRKRGIGRQIGFLFLLLVGTFGLLAGDRAVGSEATGSEAADRDTGSEAEVTTRGGPLHVVTISGSINPASADYLIQAIEDAHTGSAGALLLELDTPGGLVASTKDIIQAMLGSKVPIIVYVSPAGAWAGSAGTFITLAGHVAAMAPGSSIGAASPVGIGGGNPGGSPAPAAPGEEGQPAPAAENAAAQKAENLLSAFIESIAEQRNRNVEWAREAVTDAVAVTADEAAELNVIDFVAQDRRDLLEKTAGVSFDLAGEPTRLELADAQVVDVEMKLMTKILNVIVDPNVAVLLFMGGLLGLYMEFNNPGLIIPGALGAVSLMLAMIAMQILPFSWVGVLLILIGIGFFVAELFFTSFGVLFALGVGSLLLGGSMIFDRPEVSDLNVSFWPVLVPAVGGMAAFAAIVVFAVGRSMGRAQVAGTSELVGMRGMASTALDPAGTVFVRGEYWRARSQEGAIEEGTPVEAVDVDGLELRVRSVERATRS